MKQIKGNRLSLRLLSALLALLLLPAAVTADSVEVECNLVVLYGHSVVEIAKNVQTGVTSAVESMAGIKVSKVDVNIVGISMSRA